VRLSYLIDTKDVITSKAFLNTIEFDLITGTETYKSRHLLQPLFLKNSQVQITECEITVSVCILEGFETRAFGIWGYFPQQPKYQEFSSINAILKELCF
jgi:hypothetical protein